MFAELIRKSVQFDIATLRIRRLRLTERVKFVLRKNRAAAFLMLGAETASVRLRGRDFVVHNLSELGTMQSSLVDVYRDLVQGQVLADDSPSVVDIGANIGQFAFAVQTFYPSARIVSFEPGEVAYERLERNLGDHPHITLSPLAISDEIGLATFFERDLNVTSSLIPPSVDDTTVGRDGTIVNEHVVETATLDSLDLAEIDLLKIDVEGAELEVLRGSVRTMPLCRFLLVEVSLRRSTTGSNFSLLTKIGQTVPSAQIRQVGRPLGNGRHQVCVDLLIELNDDGRTLDKPPHHDDRWAASRTLQAG